MTANDIIRKKISLAMEIRNGLPKWRFIRRRGLTQAIRWMIACEHDLKKCPMNVTEREHPA